jgi:hypothetical protein
VLGGGPASRSAESSRSYSIPAMTRAVMSVCTPTKWVSRFSPSTTGEMVNEFQNGAPSLR